MGLRDLVVDGRALMKLLRDGEVNCVLVRDRESDGKQEQSL